MTKPEFAVKILLEYASENGINGRDTTDLSPLEKWLILKLYELSDVSEQLDCDSSDEDYWDKKSDGERLDWIDNT